MNFLISLLIIFSFPIYAADGYVLSHAQQDIITHPSIENDKPIKRCRLFSDVAAYTLITVPTTISTSGHYLLANDISTTGTGIIIAANNVILDLDGRVISNGGGGIAGVAVNAGFSNIVIGNGVIQDMTLNGIAVQQASYCTILDCVVNNCLRGIYLNGATYCSINNCKAYECDTAGFSVNGSAHNFISKCKSINTSSASASFGFFSTNGTHNRFEECIAVDTHTTGTTFGIFPCGFGFTGTESQSSIMNCESNHTYAPTTGLAQPFGIALNATVGTITNVSQNTFGRGTVYAVEWTPDVNDSIFAAGGTPDGKTNVRVFSYDFDSATLKLLAEAKEGGTTRALSWSSTSAYLAVAGDPDVNYLLTTKIYAFDEQNGLSLISTTTATTASNAVAWSPNNNYLATGGSDGDIAVHQFDRYAVWYLTSKAHGAAVRSVQWSHDGNYLAVGGDVSDAEVRVYSWNGSTLTQVATASHGAAINSVAWSPTDDYLVVGGATSGGVNVRAYRFDGASLTQVAAAAHGATVNSVVISPRGTTVGIGGLTGTGSVQVRVYTFTGALLVPTTTYAHGAPVYSLSIDPLRRLVGLGGDLANTDPIGGIDLINNIRVLNVNVSTVSNCIVKDNNVFFTTGGLFPGVGIAAIQPNNLVEDNTVFGNDVSLQL